MENSRTCYSWAQSQSPYNFLQDPELPGLQYPWLIFYTSPPHSSSSTTLVSLPLSSLGTSTPLGLCIHCSFCLEYFPPKSHQAWFPISFIFQIKCHLLRNPALTTLLTISSFFPLSPSSCFRTVWRKSRGRSQDSPFSQPVGCHCT